MLQVHNLCYTHRCCCRKPGHWRLGNAQWRTVTIRFHPSSESRCHSSSKASGHSRYTRLQWETIRNKGRWKTEERQELRSADIIHLSFMCYFMIKEREVFIIVCIYWMRLTALQLQRAVLCVQREAAEVHRAESRHSDPETPTHTDIKQLPLQLSLTVRSYSLLPRNSSKPK